jgi:hypothetical protein
MGVGGCLAESERPDISRTEAAEAKADGFTDDLCGRIGADAGCDLCDEVGFYDDGVCDEFCDEPDPDCATVLYGVPMEACDDRVDNDGDRLIDCDDGDCDADPSCGPVVEYGVPFETECRDGVDNDGDGLVDCADSDCIDTPDCTIPAYAVPFETECRDGVDNDGDGLVDCDDSDCADDCRIFPIMPAPETDCRDGVDNDGDGLVDCDDSDCTDDCRIFPIMPLGERDCADGVDDDGDGLVDCADPDCLDAEGCIAPAYAVPFETDCADGIDNDGDRLVDCDDGDCADDCGVFLYAAPF